MKTKRCTKELVEIIIKLNDDQIKELLGCIQDEDSKSYEEYKGFVMENPELITAENVRKLDNFLEKLYKMNIKTRFAIESSEDLDLIVFAAKMFLYHQD